MLVVAAPPFAVPQRGMQTDTISEGGTNFATPIEKVLGGDDPLRSTPLLIFEGLANRNLSTYQQSEAWTSCICNSGRNRKLSPIDA